MVTPAQFEHEIGALIGARVLVTAVDGELDTSSA